MTEILKNNFDFENLAQLVSFQGKKFNNPNALNFKENNQLISFSNQQFLNKIICFALGLKSIGLQARDHVAIFSYQNPIWLIADLGVILANAISIPIFHNIANDNLIYQINDSESKFIFTDNCNIFDLIKNTKSPIKVISYGFEHQDAISFDQLIKLGEQQINNIEDQLELLIKNINSQQLATIIYTSGSTGNPKGVCITHHNLVSQINDSKAFFPLNKNEIVLSYLPLAHIFERMVMLYYIASGVSVYFVDDVKNISLFLQEFKPNLMTTVPRVLEKVYGKINLASTQGSFIKQIIAKIAIKRALSRDPFGKKNFLQKNIDNFFDLIVYHKFRSALGGNMRMIICGGAALSLDLQKFYFNIKINIYCGYGLTEASPVIATNCPSSFKLDSVGKVFNSVKVKIADDRELLACGDNIMKGYYKLDKETQACLEGGYLKTGDLAEIDQNGFIKIIGRKKELFKTSNGKYVNPVLIEQKLIQEFSFLLASMVIADNRRFVSVLLFPEFEILDRFRVKLKFLGDLNQFINSKILNDFIAKKIVKINNHLNHAEQIQKFKIIDQMISIENGDITPSMKLKRNFLEQKFSKIIEELYL